jgi:cyclopropane-fatty-acyl-phospholipid synthase
LNQIWSRPRRTRQSDVRKQISSHYDLGNDFYGLWLDEQLLYTCAYFESPTVSLEHAQRAKMDLIARKLRLRRNEQVIEAGCGWGALAIHLAQYFGVRVKAYNISREQLKYARERVQRENLGGRVEFVEADWREMDGHCDAFVSVGMLEHVRPENYAILGKKIREVLRPHGRGLIHSITQKYRERLNPWIERKIFPGALPPTLAQMMTIFDSSRHTVYDVENLRVHYARTLQQWLSRFESEELRIVEMFDETFVRAWRLYLASSQAAFETGELDLLQVVFGSHSSDAIPETRADIFASAF